MKGSSHNLLRQAPRGFTLLEMIITVAILSIVVAGAFPIARNAIQRQREVELRRALREIRQAIDTYKTFCDRGGVGPLDREADDNCYPKSLEALVKGVIPPNKTDPERFLRRIPIDPMTNSTKWATVSVQDGKESTGVSNSVWDVHTTSDGTALDGSKYKEW